MTILSGACRVKGGPALGRHLAAGPGSPVHARGIACTTMADAIAELAAGAMPTRTSRPLWHVHADPGQAHPHMLPVFWRLLEAEFGLQQARYVGREHRKGSRPDHAHRVYDVTRPDGSVVDLRFDRMRREKVAVVVAHTLKLPFPPVPHRRAIARALHKDGRHDIAAWVDAQDPGPTPIAITTPQDRQQEVRTGCSRAEAEAAALAAWTASDNGPAFRAALAARGLTLADGGKVPVVVGGNAVWPLARLLGSASRRDGARISAAAVKARLAGLHLLPVDQARLPTPPALDMAAVGKRVADLQAGIARAEAEIAELRRRTASKAVREAIRTAAGRETATAGHLARHDQARRTVDDLERAEPATILARLWDRVRWQRAASRRQALAMARSEAEQAAQDHATATILAQAARRRAIAAESTWRETVASDIDKVARRREWLAEAVAAIERTPALALASDDALSAALRQARRQPPRSDFTFGPRSFGQHPEPRYTPR